MIACIQRVTRASVTVDGNVVGNIDKGVVVLLGVAAEDTEDDARLIAEKLAALRIFEDADNKMNLSIRDVGGSALVVSQFTLLADCRKGRRPSFTAAAPPESAQALYEVFCERLKEQGVPVATGVFRAHMEVALVNDGPVTILLDSLRLKGPRRGPR
ncbi:MAG: D-tyrosyl-tRNA(Tyr) deacylase [Planctomycetota bacterium]|nr:MAG: D-tyrosyl-tRNA(Tyr) deacylase [Planctomycetota bacterium]